MLLYGRCCKAGSRSERRSAFLLRGQRRFSSMVAGTNGGRFSLRNATASIEGGAGGRPGNRCVQRRVSDEPPDPGVFPATRTAGEISSRAIPRSASATLRSFLTGQKYPVLAGLCSTSFSIVNLNNGCSFDQRAWRVCGRWPGKGSNLSWWPRVRPLNADEWRGVHETPSDPSVNAF